MPLYTFFCSSCQKNIRKILKPEQYENDSPFFCQCLNELTPTPSGPSTQVMEVLDNGLMSKRIERFKDAQTLFKERSDKFK